MKIKKENAPPPKLMETYMQFNYTPAPFFFKILTS